MRRLGLYWSALLWACSGDKAATGDTGALPSEDGDADTDTDSDSDADTDADTDTDTDTDSDAPITMNGSIDVFRLNLEVLDPVPVPPTTVCDETFTLTGTDYTGYCPGCTFAFNVTSTPDTPVPANCPTYRLYPLYTFDATAYYGGEYIPAVGFAPSYTSLYGYTYTNALLQGYSLWLYGPTYPVYVWRVLRADEFDDDTFSFDGTTLRWTDQDFGLYAYGAGPYLYTVDPTCPILTATIYQIADQIDPDVTGQEQIECTLGMYGDVWEVEANAGDILQVSVDTIGLGSAFDPRLTVLGPDGCFTLQADENADCTYPPPTGYYCPSGEFVAPVDGSYKIQISAFPILASCANGSAGSYVLRVASPNNPVNEVSLVHDDLLLFNELVEFDLSYDLTLEVLP